MEAGFTERAGRVEGGKTSNAYEQPLDPVHDGETCMAGART
jgi:hypothetical protein